MFCCSCISQLVGYNMIYSGSGPCARPVEALSMSLEGRLPTASRIQRRPTSTQLGRSLLSDTEERCLHNPLPAKFDLTITPACTLRSPGLGGLYVRWSRIDWRNTPSATNGGGGGGGAERPRTSRQS